MSRSLSSHDAENIIGLLQSSSGEYQTEADWSQSRSALSLAAEVLHPKEALESNTGRAGRRTGLHGCWVGGEEGEGGLCAGLIILSTEWAHITKDLLSLAGELLRSGNSARPLCLPGDRKMWPSSASVGRFNQQQTLSVVHKAASVFRENVPFHRPTLRCLPPLTWFLQVQQNTLSGFSKKHDYLAQDWTTAVWDYD